MVNQSRFCTNCGNLLGKDDQFCSSCGKPAATKSTQETVSEQAEPFAPPPISRGEQLLGIIPAVSRKKGFMSMECFNIVVTGKRMIFALMTNEMIAEEAQKEGKRGGFFDRIAAATTVGYTLHKRYFDMAPDAVLKENPGNFFIDIDKVRKIRLIEGKRSKRSWDASPGEYYQEDGQLEIQAVGGKYSFKVPHNFHGVAHQVLQKAGLL